MGNSEMGPKLTREGGREGGRGARTDAYAAVRQAARKGGRRGFVFLHCCRRAAVASLIRPSLSLSLFLVAMTLAIAANLLTSKDSPALAAAAALAFVSMLKLRLAFPVQSYHAISRWSEAAGVQTRMNVNSVTEIFHRSSSGSERWKVAKCSELAKMNCFSIVRC